MKWPPDSLRGTKSLGPPQPDTQRRRSTRPNHAHTARQLQQVDGALPSLPQSLILNARDRLTRSDQDPVRILVTGLSASPPWDLARWY
jgi:hypothetical protein